MTDEKNIDKTPVDIHTEETAKVDERDMNYMIESNQTVEILAEILQEIVNENTDNEINDNELFTSFFSLKPPIITIKNYLKRIIKYSKPEPSTIILSLIYIDKICEESDLELSQYNIHKIILTAIVIALKNNEDDYYSNKYYAKVGGITLTELNELEMNMLILLKFNTYVSDEIYDKYEEQMDNFHSDEDTF